MIYDPELPEGGLLGQLSVYQPNLIETNTADARFQQPSHQNSAEELPLAVNVVANDGSPVTEVNPVQNSPSNDAS